MPCALCRAPIKAGQRFVQTAGNAHWHPACRRLARFNEKQSIPLHTSGARFTHDDPVGQDCEGCGMPVQAGEPVVFVMTRPWHRDCRRRSAMT
jgi:hypothetical protein